MLHQSFNTSKGHVICFFLQLATQFFVLKNVYVISKEMLDMQKTFIVKFNEEVCLAICQFYS